MEPAQDRRVVLLVVSFLGILSCGGLAALVFLIHSGTDATALLAITSAQNLAAGALAGILASTRSSPPAPIQQAQAQGYQQAVADVKAFNSPPAADPAEPVFPPTLDPADA